MFYHAELKHLRERRGKVGWSTLSSVPVFVCACLSHRIDCVKKIKIMKRLLMSNVLRSRDTSHYKSMILNLIFRTKLLYKPFSHNDIPRGKYGPHYLIQSILFQSACAVIRCPSEEVAWYYHLYFQKINRAQDTEFPSDPLTMYPCRSWCASWERSGGKEWGWESGRG